MDIWGRGAYYKAKKFVSPKRKKKQKVTSKLFKKLF